MGIVITNYRKAWIDYKKTSEYNQASTILKIAGIKQPYRDNILQSVFAAGWNATNVKIKDFRSK
jgi:hypothetical protein